VLSKETRNKLSHRQIATLLASDEANIFATARYMRRVADDGATRSLAELPHTREAFPTLDLARFAFDSSMWNWDNIRALASEYTSKPWDDVVFPLWGEFVLAAYQDVIASRVFSQ
jgi:hypothetical protein